MSNISVMIVSLIYWDQNLSVITYLLQEFSLLQVRFSFFGKKQESGAGQKHLLNRVVTESEGKHKFHTISIVFFFTLLLNHFILVFALKKYRSITLFSLLKIWIYRHRKKHCEDGCRSRSITQTYFNF